MIWRRACVGDSKDSSGGDPLTPRGVAPAQPITYSEQSGVRVSSLSHVKFLSGDVLCMGSSSWWLAAHCWPPLLTTEVLGSRHAHLPVCGLPCLRISGVSYDGKAAVSWGVGYLSTSCRYTHYIQGPTAWAAWGRSAPCVRHATRRSTSVFSQP